ncbi:MAG: PD40 domain-containing protein, partial [Oscillospiraceae bacterium]|nr:PD40 domain-containing protein [Oscillospiraceae bacterium]
MDSGEIETLAEFDDLIEAPNWSKDGKYLVYNSEGRIFRFDLETKESIEIPTGFVNACNNDHVLSPDGSAIAVSHH